MRIIGESNDAEPPVYNDCLYIDTGDDGRVVQEVSFICRTLLLPKYKRDAAQAFGSLHLR